MSATIRVKKKKLSKTKPRRSARNKKAD